MSVMMSCPVCEGDRVIPIAWKDGRAVETATCPRCGGTGDGEHEAVGAAAAWDELIRRRNQIEDGEGADSGMATAA
jgi:Zn-finger nucleic acid-binding protein